MCRVQYMVNPQQVREEVFFRRWEALSELLTVFDTSLFASGCPSLPNWHHPLLKPEISSFLNPDIQPMSQTCQYLPLLSYSTVTVLLKECMTRSNDSNSVFHSCPRAVNLLQGRVLKPKSHHVCALLKIIHWPPIRLE